MNTPQKSFVRVGIIGVGNIGSAHAASIAADRIDGMRLCALCDTDARRAAQLRERYPQVPIFEREDDFFACDQMDAVIIATPHYDHPRLAIRAFGAGLHVLTEKPGGVYTSAVREMIDAAKQSGKVFSVMYNQRTNKLFREAKRLMDEGAVGELKRVVWIITNWYRKQCYYDSGAWRATWSGEGGGVLMNQAPHNLDLWQWLCGMPASVRAVCPVARFHDIEVEDEATILARYENGASGVFITSTGDYPGTNRLEITGTRAKMVIEQKTLSLYRLQMDERDFCTTEDAVKNPVDVLTISDEPYNGHENILQNFANAILFGEPLIAPGEDSLAEVSLCNAAYLSAWENRDVLFPLDDAYYLSRLRLKIESSHLSSPASSSSPSTSYAPKWTTNW